MKSHQKKVSQNLQSTSNWVNFQLKKKSTYSIILSKIQSLMMLKCSGHKLKLFGMQKNQVYFNLYEKTQSIQTSTNMTQMLGLSKKDIKELL